MDLRQGVVVQSMGVMVQYIAHLAIVFRRVTIQVLLLQVLLQHSIIRSSDLHFAEKNLLKFLLLVPNV